MSEINPKKPDSQGWVHDGIPVKNGEDSRRLVSLEQDGMSWVGIRSWHSTDGIWYNGSEPEHATVRAWQKLPDPTRSFWQGGRFYGDQS